MTESTMFSKEMQAKVKQLEAQMQGLQESIDDSTLTKDDLEAIDEGIGDLVMGRTRRL